MRPKVGTPDKIVFFGPPSQTLLFGAYSFEGGDSFLLLKTECHYSEYGDNRISIFLIPMHCSIVWTGSPKGALMQTSFACGGDFAPCTPTREPTRSPRPLPNRAPVGCRKRLAVSSRQGEPTRSPLTPCPTLRGLDARQGFRPCTSAGASLPCDPGQARGDVA